MKSKMAAFSVEIELSPVPSQCWFHGFWRRNPEGRDIPSVFKAFGINMKSVTPHIDNPKTIFDNIIFIIYIYNPILLLIFGLLQPPISISELRSWWCRRVSNRAVPEVKISNVTTLVMWPWGQQKFDLENQRFWCHEHGSMTLRMVWPRFVDPTIHFRVYLGLLKAGTP